MHETGEKPAFLLRLAEKLEAEVKYCGSFQKLEEAIVKANDGQPKRRIDRRKISRIVNDRRSEALTIDELQSLDTYLLSRGSGLSKLFDHASILREIVETGQLTFLMASKPREAAMVDDISRWDIKSMGELLLALGKSRVPLNFSIEDVALRDATFTQPVSALGSEHWYELLESDGPSLICLGSPRACHASELMLATMFNVEPFTVPSAHEFPLPFYFVWKPDSTGHFKSTFAMPAHQLHTIDATLATKVADSQEKTWAFVCDKTAYEARRRGRKWTTYGVIAAQRRPSGRVWLVVSGLTGPATYGAAKVVASLSDALPRTGIGQSSPTLWVPVEISVEITARSIADNRHVASARLLSSIRWYPQGDA